MANALASKFFTPPMTIQVLIIIPMHYGYYTFYLE